MASKSSLEFSALVSGEEAATYLDALARGVRDGAALFESGDKSITLQLGPSLRMKLEAETDLVKGKSSVDLSLSWRTADRVVAGPGLTIDAGRQAHAAAAKAVAVEEAQPGSSSDEADAARVDFKGFNLRTKTQVTILEPRIVTMKNGRKGVQGIASDDNKTKVFRILSKKEALEGS